MNFSHNELSDDRPATEPEKPSTPTLSTNRPAYDQEQFDQHYVYEPPPTSPWNGLRRSVSRGWRSSRSLCSLSYFFHWLMLEHFPMIDWVRHYKLKTMLPKDVLAGITCGIMQVPQGMAYGMLAGTGPVVGLYTAFVPPLVYSAFASSRHVSVASFAVLSMLTASVIRPNVEAVKKLLLKRAGSTMSVLPGTAFANSSLTSLMNDDTRNSFSGALTIVDDAEYTQYVVVRLATSICLACGLLLLALGVLRLGFISCYLSDALIAGFCAGASIHIFTTQLFPALGLKSTNPAGWFMLYYSYKELLQQLPQIKLYTTGLSIICVAILYLVKTYINGNARAMKRMHGIPIPIELVLVVATTLLSYFFNFSAAPMQIKSVGNIPVGIIAPVAPDVEITMMVFGETLIISFVILALTISIGRVLAKKNDTPLDPSTELRALGFSNIAGSFFQCIPAGCAMARTMVLAGIGAPTQLTNFIGCAIVFSVLQWLGKLLEPLPGAVLASIVIVAVKPLFMTVFECWRLLHVSWIDASIYLVTFTAIILGEVGTGIVIGLAYSIFTIVIRTQYPHVYVLGRLRNTELYKPLGEYRACAELIGLRILRVSAPIYFANVDYLRTRCLELVFNTDKYRALALQKRHRRRSQVHHTDLPDAVKAERQRKIANANNNIAMSTVANNDDSMMVVDINGNTSFIRRDDADDAIRMTESDATLTSVVVNNNNNNNNNNHDHQNALSNKFPALYQPEELLNRPSINGNNSLVDEDGTTRQRRKISGILLKSGSQHHSHVMNTDDVTPHSGIEIHPPKRLSDVLETEERERGLRPPRLSVVFAGIGDVNDTDLDAAILEAGSLSTVFIGNAMAPHHVIVDCSSVSFVDTAGVTMLVAFVRECWKKAATQVFFAHCPRNVREQIRRNCTICGNDLPDSCFFPTIHDAVLFGVAVARQQALAQKAIGMQQASV